MTKVTQTNSKFAQKIAGHGIVIHREGINLLKFAQWRCRHG